MVNSKASHVGRAWVLIGLVNQAEQFDLYPQGCGESMKYFNQGNKSSKFGLL